MFKPNDKLSINEQHDEILAHPNMAADIISNYSKGMNRKDLATFITRQLNHMGYGVSQAKVARRVKQVLG